MDTGVARVLDHVYLKDDLVSRAAAKWNFQVHSNLGSYEVTPDIVRRLEGAGLGHRVSHPAPPRAELQFVGQIQASGVMLQPCFPKLLRAIDEEESVRAVVVMAGSESRPHPIVQEILSSRMVPVVSWAKIEGQMEFEGMRPLDELFESTFENPVVLYDLVQLEIFRPMPTNDRYAPVSNQGAVAALWRRQLEEFKASLR